MVTKLCDNDFFRKAKAADVFTKVYRLFLDMSIGKGDKVFIFSSNIRLIGRLIFILQGS